MHNASTTHLPSHTKINLKQRIIQNFKRNYLKAPKVQSLETDYMIGKAVDKLLSETNPIHQKDLEAFNNRLAITLKLIE